MYKRTTVIIIIYIYILHSLYTNIYIYIYYTFAAKWIIELPPSPATFPTSKCVVGHYLHQDRELTQNMEAENGHLEESDHLPNPFHSFRWRNIQHFRHRKKCDPIWSYSPPFVVVVKFWLSRSRSFFLMGVCLGFLTGSWGRCCCVSDRFVTSCHVHEESKSF